MKYPRNLTGIFAGLGMLVLIFDSSLALEGAQNGINLCIRTVIPSLFPFILLSMLLTREITGTNRWLRPVTECLGIPYSAQTLLIPAFLGGYPVGAKCIYDLYRGEQLQQNQAERLLCFCSNAGPAFLFGMLSGFFPEKKTLWLLWLIHILSAVLTGFLFSAAETAANAPVRTSEKSGKQDVLLAVLKSMGLICGWVILFRILVTFLQQWFLWLLPQWLMVLFTGILELTNGCCELMQISDIGVRFVICSCMLAFGGICVLLQTASVTKGLSLRYYVLGKGMQTIFSLLLSCAVIWKHGWLLTSSIPLLCFFIRKNQKSSGNTAIVPV